MYDTILSPKHLALFEFLTGSVFRSYLSYSGQTILKTFRSQLEKIIMARQYLKELYDIILRCSRLKPNKISVI